MSRRSPTLKGFRLIFSRPSLGLAEIAWRWSFWSAGWFLFLVGFREYLASLSVSGSDMFLLGTRQPVLISKALRHIFSGSSVRVAEAGVALWWAGTLAWILIASIGRSATLQNMVEEFRNGERPSHVRFRSLLVIHWLRSCLLVAAVVGMAFAFLAAARVTAPTNPAPGSAMLVFLTAALVVFCVWSLLNWFLSFASIFVVARGCDTLTAFADACDTFGTRLGSVAAVSTWFGLAHFVALSVASSAIAFPLAFASILPFGVVLGGTILVILLYSAVADFLYAGRLAAYVAILEQPQAAPETRLPVRQLFVPQVPSGRIDPDELILSDVPV